MAFSWLLRRFDGYLYVGQRNREYLLHYGARADRLFFSPHCVDNEAFRAASEAARPALAGRKRCILFVGKLVERKRPIDVLRAAAVFRRNHGDIDVAFAGTGELETALRREAATLELPVIFHGFVNQSALPAVYAAADVVVLPSDGRETWGLVVNEAMACGVPAVVSDAVGCGPDLVEGGATGAVFPLGDIGAMARAIETAISLPTETTRRLLAERTAIYSPRRAAQGIIEATATLAARPPIESEKR